MLACRRLCDAKFVRRGGDRTDSDVSAQDLDLAPDRAPARPRMTTCRRAPQPSMDAVTILSGSVLATT